MSGPASDTDPLHVTADEIREVLERVVDPCSKALGAPVGLVSMGLVLEVWVDGVPGAAIVTVQLGITEPGCMMQGIFSAAAERDIRALPGVADVVVRIDHGYVWDPEAMAPDYRARLSTLRRERRLRAEHRSLQDSQPRDS